MKLRKSIIAGTGSNLPDKVLTNSDLEKMVDTNDEWIFTRSGIRERRIVDKGVSASDLSVGASLKAMKMANVSPEEIDKIILATVTPDGRFPASACYLQDKISAKNAMAVDISAACSGFVYAVEFADALISAGKDETILVVGVDIMSSILDWQDRSTCVLFGDGAGAVIMKPSPNDERGILSIYTKSDGSLANLLYADGGSKVPFTKELIESKKHFVQMEGKNVFKYAVRYMIESIEKVIEPIGAKFEDIDLLVPHQANIRIIDATIERANIPREKTLINIDRYANTTAGTIPIALDEAVQTGRVKEGDLVVMVTFGGGFTWGAIAMRW